MSRADVEVAPSEPVGTVDLAVVDGSAQIGYSDAARAIEGMIQAADNRILIQTPYFNPPGAVCEMLTDAVDRGVDVEVVVPGPHIDKRVSAVAAEDLYSPMIDKGVKVWVYQPTMMHVKAILVDGALSLVGSVNLNRRSLAKDEEVAVAVLDDGITAILERHFIADRAKSEMGLSEIRRPAHRRVVSKLVKPLSPEL